MKQPLTFVQGCNTEPETIREQFKINVDRDIPFIKECLPEYLPIDMPIAIVCGGPSLERRWEELKEFTGRILACNGAYKFLYEKGIKPHAFMLLDCREDNIEFILPHLTTSYLIATQAHPSIFDFLQESNCFVYKYLTNLPDIKELLGDRLKNEKFTILGGTVGTVGIKAMSMAHALGFREMHLYGFDSSYEGDNHHAYPQPLNDETRRIEVFVEDRKYITSASFAHQAQEFPAWAKDLVQFHGCQIELHCDGLLPDLMDYCNRVGEEKSLEEREKEKYEQIWNHDVYRKFAPGEGMVDDAFKVMGMSAGEYLYDFGCGTGRAAQKFKEKYRIKVVGIDHANNCLDKDVDILLRVSNLWEFKGENNIFDLRSLKSDWGFCTDVMEHIPTEKVMLALKCISDSVIKGCYFNIATRDDNMGTLVGKKLHMTIATAGAWKEMLEKYFKEVKCTEKEGEATFACFK